MKQFFDNICISLTTENIALVNIMMIPATIIENYLVMYFFLIILNLSSNKIQKFTYIMSISIISLLNFYFIPQPFNTIINYIVFPFLINYIFKLNILKSYIIFFICTFVFGLLNIFMQNPYLIILNLNQTKFINTPIYRFLYLIILYTCLFFICLMLKKFKLLKLNVDLFDSLDRKTLLFIYATIFVGFLTLCIQLILTAFYIDMVPIIISFLNFILLIAFLLITSYSFTRIIKLVMTKRDLQSAEEYNKSLEFLYDKVKGFKHDFDNIVSTIDGFILTKDINGLKKYFDNVKKDCNIAKNLSLLNPRRINNPGIYSLLNNKYFKATESGVTFDIDYFINLDDVKINLYQFSRILGVLIDNAIEEAQKCEEKLVKVTFRKEEKNRRSIIIVENTYSNKDVDLEKIYEKGLSSKENHSGFGLWEVRKFISKSTNLDLYTTKNNKFFTQELAIYDF